MQDPRNRQRSIGFSVVTLLIAGLITACTNPAMGPISQTTDSPNPPKDKGLLALGMPVVQSPGRPDYIVVEHGQSLNRIAHAHHVTPAALAAANHLEPPYKLRVGSKLILPGAGPPTIQQANAASLPRSPTPTSSPPKGESTAATAPQPVPPAAAPVDRRSTESAAPQPLQMQAQAAPLVATAPPVMPPRNPAAALPLPGEPLIWPTDGRPAKKMSEGPTN